MPDFLPVIIAALIASLPGVYATWQNRRLRDADVTSKIAEAAAGLLDDMREQVIHLGNRVKDQEHQIAILHETAMKALLRLETLEKEKVQWEAERTDLNARIRALTGQVRELLEIIDEMREVKE